MEGRYSQRIGDGKVTHPNTSGPRSPHYQGLSWTVDGVWITHNSRESSVACPQSIGRSAQQCQGRLLELVLELKGYGYVNWSLKP